MHTGIMFCIYWSTQFLHIAQCDSQIQNSILRSHFQRHQEKFWFMEEDNQVWKTDNFFRSRWTFILDLDYTRYQS